MVGKMVVEKEKDKEDIKMRLCSGLQWSLLCCHIAVCITIIFLMFRISGQFQPP